MLDVIVFFELSSGATLRFHFFLLKLTCSMLGWNQQPLHHWPTLSGNHNKHFNRTDIYLIFYKKATIELNSDLIAFLTLRRHFTNTITFPVVPLLIYLSCLSRQY